ncbi:MAG: LPS assembly lipoprotein LptE [Chitinophagaceae bacterium]
MNYQVIYLKRKSVGSAGHCMSYGLAFTFLLMLMSSCSIYKFKDTNFPPDIKTVKLNFFENKARYINPQLAPKLNERLQQKMISQTPLKRSTSDEADYVIIGWISDYYVTTAGVSNQQVSSSNLNVAIHVILKNNKTQKTDEYDVSKAFPFNGQKTLQEVENSLTDDIVKGISDEIFNRLFSNW